MQPDLAHKAVHHIGGAGHVAGLFHDGEHDVHGEQPGDKDQNPADPGDDPVNQQGTEPVRGVKVDQQGRDPASHVLVEEAIDPVQVGSGYVLDDIEDQIHDQQEDRQAEIAVSEDAVELI